MELRLILDGAELQIHLQGDGGSGTKHDEKRQSFKVK